MQTEIDFENEIWKDIIGFEGRFKISSRGNIIFINGRYSGEKLLNPYIGKKEGYYTTNLRNGKGVNLRTRIHVLVAQHFVEKSSPEFNVVNHLDGNKLNNYFKNLEWTDRDGNIKHAVRIGIFNIKGDRHPNRKLTSEQVYQIKFCYSGKNNRELMSVFKVSREQIRDIRLNKNWQHITEDYYNPIS